MRYAAVELANKITSLEPVDLSWDLVLCTDMMNLAEFKSLCRRIADAPTVVYFHENQFAYPNRGKQQPDHHFLFTNMVTALAADEVWFNSQFNQQSFLRGLKSNCCDWAEIPESQEVESVTAKSRIVPPPISVGEDSKLDELNHERRNRIESGSPLHLVWAARWEYDKNPQALLKCLELLSQQRVPFQLSVIGETPESTPKAFQTIQEKFETQSTTGASNRREKTIGLFCNRQMSFYLQQLTNSLA